MTPRQRFIETLTFGTPDRIPFVPGGPRESTLAAWHTQGLPKDVAWFGHLLEVLGIDPAPMQTKARVDLGVDFRMIPQFEEKVLERRDGHLVVQDWKGNICEISDAYDLTYLREAKDFVTRRWIRCPVETRDQWAEMAARYDVNAPGRFPRDFAERCHRLADRDYVLTVAFPGPFWQMREWCSFEPLCVMMIESPEWVDAMAAAWTEFVSTVLERILAHIVPDIIHISEDMAYKEHAMISPAMVRRFCSPAYDRWTAQARAAGVPLVDVDSDGFIGELIPIWIDSGVNVCDPMEVAAGNDLAALRREHGRQMAFRGGIDKRAMAAGGEVIRRELARVAPVIRDGGYLPSCDHGVPADVSWPAFVDYSRRLAELTGWL
jgi:Uroporphyrinogen decarboxylase (URO-D)